MPCQGGVTTAPGGTVKCDAVLDEGADDTLSAFEMGRVGKARDYQDRGTPGARRLERNSALQSNHAIKALNVGGFCDAFPSNSYAPTTTGVRLAPHHPNLRGGLAIDSLRLSLHRELAFLLNPENSSSPLVSSAPLIVYFSSSVHVLADKQHLLVMSCGMPFFVR